MALLIVGIGDCRVSNDPSDILITHALGSCIAIVLYDPLARVAGLLHYMLPESSLDPGKATTRPFMFADTGIPLLLQHAFQLGAARSRCFVIATGGARMLDPNGTFDIGQRNHLAMREIFSSAGIRVSREDIGGTSSRAISVEVASGHVTLRMPGQADCDLRVSGGAPCRS
jgi:chemotaxis protein CheD